MNLKWKESSILSTENVKTIPPVPGVYKILAKGEKGLLYIGESNSLTNRLKSHVLKNWGTDDVYFSYVPFEKDILPHQLKEIENDLIGSHFAAVGEGPYFQFKNLD
nr:GIY-YIG nuclease family protein [Heliobacterium chlorum]